MQPFDYASIMRQGQALVPDFATQEANRQLSQIRQMQINAAEQEEADEQRFQTDLSEVLSGDPTPDTWARMALRHPKRAEALKAGHEMMDAPRKMRDKQQLGSISIALANGKDDLALKLLRQRADADRAAGGDTGDEDEMIADIESGDAKRRNAAANYIGMVGSSLFGKEWDAIHPQAEKPTAFMQNYEFINSKNSGLGEQYMRTEAEGRPIIGYGADGQPILVPLGSLPRYGEKGGGQTSGGGGGSAPPSGPAVSAVASTLSSAGLPAPVVAGFIGNFDAEGGYGGAKGDGGSAAGIAQWRGKRQVNFKRVTGKEPGAASYEEQAKFVAWEMQNPEAAGMTVAQRDAILNAKTPAQAAALIDQFYERSSGEHRQRRMQAANSYAGAARGATQVRSKQEYDRLPQGSRYIAPDGSERVKG